MGRVLHPNAFFWAHANLLMVVLVVEVDNFDLGLIDAKRQSPVFGDEQTPRSFAVTGQLMCFPARDGPEFHPASPCPGGRRSCGAASPRPRPESRWRRHFR